MKILTDGPLRPARRRRAPAKETLRAEIAAVRRGGDAALGRLRGGEAAVVIPRAEQKRAFARLHPGVRQALEVACRHTGALGRRQLAARRTFDLRPRAGLSIYHRHVPLGAVGVVVPLGRVSVLISGAISAALAGVPERVVCTPAGPDGRVPEALLAAAFMCDVTTLCVAQGAAAVAALAYGTESVPRVDRIVGVGGAAELAAGALLAGRCEISLALPPDLLVVADRTAPPDFVAADLLAHAEASPEADAALLTTSEAVARDTAAELRRLARRLGLPDPVRRALRRGRARVARDAEEALALANDYAPGVACLMVERPAEWLAGLRSAGTVLLGAHTPPTLGEFATGTSNLLLSGAAARARQALTVESFARAVDSQMVDPSAYPRIARVGEVLARLEGRQLAVRSLRVRLGPVAPEGEPSPGS